MLLVQRVRALAAQPRHVPQPRRVLVALQALSHPLTLHHLQLASHIQRGEEPLTSHSGCLTRCVRLYVHTFSPEPPLTRRRTANKRPLLWSGDDTASQTGWVFVQQTHVPFSSKSHDGASRLNANAPLSMVSDACTCRMRDGVFSNRDCA